MEAPLDLYRANREDLIALVLRQRERIADVEREQARLRAELEAQRAAVARLQERVGQLLAVLEGAGGDDPPTRPTTMPGLKPAGSRRAAQPVGPRKKRARGYGRARMAPTRWQEHAYAACPRCGIPLRGGTVRHRREVIELVPARVEVTEHRYLARRCPRCRGRWQPGPELAGVVVGQGRLGIGLLSLIAVLREELRLPIRAIQWHLAALAGVSLSVGAIARALAVVAAHGAGAVAATQATIRASPVLHADETGWREAGRNGYAWTFSTPTQRLFVHGGRDRAVLEGTLGAGYAGTLVSDFYAAYTGYDGRHQYCWAHLLRDIDELAAQQRSDAAVQGWADSAHGLYRRATVDAADPARDPRRRRQQRRAYEAELGALCAPFLGVADAPQRVLAERMTKHLAELFVFVEEPAVPSTNNAAERSLRHLVTTRKISGGTRSPAGTATKMILATLFGTWRLQGRNPLEECRSLLAAPQP
jgi:transposase